MLIEIRSQKFRTGVVSFHSGLNVILGDTNATNSIGKSTMLMVVDFAFGGKDLLVHNDDVVKELGHHDYFFTFQFDDEIHRFCRDTSQPDTVYRCAADFELGPPMTLEAYTAFLRKAYEVELPDLSFRTLVSLYTRVWGKENLDPSKPLHIVPSKSGEECVDNLIKTFDRYATIRDIALKLDSTEKELKAWGTAKDHRVIPTIQKKGYDENQKSIAMLEGELSDIRANLARYTANVSEVVNRELLELKEEKDRLLALRLTLASRLQRVQGNLRGSRAIRSENFQELVRFFPAIDQDRLARVGEFHTGVARILRSELGASQREIDQSQIVALAAILADIGDSWEHDANRAKLERWYWNGVFGELYGAAVETRIAKDFMEVPAWLNNGGSEPTTVSETIFRADRLKTMRMRLSAAYKGVNALLMKEGAEDFRSGQKFDHTVFFGENVSSVGGYRDRKSRIRPHRCIGDKWGVRGDRYTRGRSSAENRWCGIYETASPT
jgi:hypothetical protein